MFGMEVLDILIGLFFVYLVLSLVCTGINEYIAALTNKRGKLLMRGIQQLLDETNAGAVKDKVINHPLLTSLRQLDRKGNTRDPAYIPARSFAMALLDAAGTQPDANGKIKTGQAPASADLAGVLDVLRRDSTGDLVQFITDPDTYTQVNLPPDVKARVTESLVGARTEYQKLQDSVEVWFNSSMDRVSGAYKRYTQAALLVIGLVVACATNADTIQIWRTLAADDALATRFAEQAAASLPRIAEMMADSVNRANGVPGTAAPADSAAAATDTATQAAPAANDAPAPAGDDAPADTSVSASEPAGTRVILAAFQQTPGTDTASDTTAASDTSTAEPETSKAPQKSEGGTGATAVPRDSLTAAQALYDSATAMLGGMELQLGWTMDEWKRTTRSFWTILAKIVGLLITTLALTMGAPFWFDTLNKFVNIRGAGRAPDEKAKSPEAPGKRLAEQPTK